VAQVGHRLGLKVGSRLALLCIHRNGCNHDDSTINIDLGIIIIIIII